MRFQKLVSAGVLAFSCSSVPAFAGSTEPVSGLPMFPGATLVEKQDPAVLCGRTVRGIQYETDAVAAKAVGFFRKALPAAATWAVPAAMLTEFLAPNGKAMVRVNGTPSGSYIIYASFSKPFTESQLRSGKC